MLHTWELFIAYVVYPALAFYWTRNQKDWVQLIAVFTGFMLAEATLFVAVKGGMIIK